MKFPLVTWLKQVWPFDPGRTQVLRAYAALGRDAHLLTDIALRGRLFSSPHVRDERGSTDQFATWINIGRQELALEILEAAHIHPEKLRQYIETKPTEGKIT